MISGRITSGRISEIFQRYSDNVLISLLMTRSERFKDNDGAGSRHRPG
jgi:hypothetical protein